MRGDDVAPVLDVTPCIVASAQMSARVVRRRPRRPPAPASRPFMRTHQLIPGVGTPCSYGYSSLWKTVGCLLPGLLFIPNKFDRLRVAPMRPFWIPGARTPLQGPQRLPDDRQHQNNEHRVSGPPADAVHSRTSYSTATPSGSFSSETIEIERRIAAAP